MICHNNLKPNNETFRAMINLRVKMKDVSFLCCCILVYSSYADKLFDYLVKHVTFIFLHCSLKVHTT